MKRRYQIVSREEQRASTRKGEVSAVQDQSPSLESSTAERQQDAPAIMEGGGTQHSGRSGLRGSRFSVWIPAAALVLLAYPLLVAADAIGVALAPLGGGPTQETSILGLAKDPASTYGLIIGTGMQRLLLGGFAFGAAMGLALALLHVLPIRKTRGAELGFPSHILVNWILACGIGCACMVMVLLSLMVEAIT